MVLSLLGLVNIRSNSKTAGGIGEFLVAGESGDDILPGCGRPCWKADDPFSRSFSDIFRVPTHVGFILAEDGKRGPAGHACFGNPIKYHQSALARVEV